MKACLKRKRVPDGAPHGALRESIRVPSTFRMLSEVRKFISAVAADCGFGSDDAFDIAVATDEALANAILHGAGGGRRGYVNIKVACKNALIITVTSKGPFKNSTSKPELVSEGGRGLWLMSALMDRVTISVGGGCTRVVMVKFKRR